MTLDQIIDEVAARASIDRLAQDNITLLRRWVNLTQQELASRYPWPWLADRETVTTVIDSTAGTVSATNASATITGSGTSFASTDVGRFIQFSSSNDWYKITAVGSGTSLTIETGYAPATETGMTYTIRTLFYILSTNVDRVMDIIQYRTPLKLTQISGRMRRLFRPLPNRTGNPIFYDVFHYQNPTSSTGQQWAVTFDPYPSTAMILEVRFLRKLPDLSLGTDVSSIPVKWHSVLVDGTAYLAYLWANNPNATGMKKVYEYGVGKMMEEAEASEDIHHIIQNFDRIGAGSRFLPFPSDFEQPY